MVEPQEKRASSQVLKALIKFQATVLKDGEEIPAEMIAYAENRISRLIQVKSDVDSQMTQIHERVKNIKEIIKENLLSDANPAGVLGRCEADYFACLEMKHVRLEELIRQDEAYCAENLELIKTQAKEIK